MINITRSQVVPSTQGIEGSTLTMSVDINIRFGFEVKWLRNGTQVTHSPGRFLIQQSFIDVMKCSLEILELKLRDQGKNFRTLMFFYGYIELLIRFSCLKIHFKVKAACLHAAKMRICCGDYFMWFRLLIQGRSEWFLFRGKKKSYRKHYISNRV